MSEDPKDSVAGIDRSESPVRLSDVESEPLDPQWLIDHLALLRETQDFLEESKKVRDEAEAAIAEYTDKLVAKMQTPEAKAGVDAFFAATPEALGEAARSAAMEDKAPTQEIVDQLITEFPALLADTTEQVEAAAKAVEAIPDLPEFIASKYARRTCGTCRGNGIVKTTASVGSLKGQKIVSPCGCAKKRYLNELNRMGHRL